MKFDRETDLYSQLHHSSFVTFLLIQTSNIFNWAHWDTTPDARIAWRMNLEEGLCIVLRMSVAARDLPGLKSYKIVHVLLIVGTATPPGHNLYYCTQSVANFEVYSGDSNAYHYLQ